MVYISWMMTMCYAHYVLFLYYLSTEQCFETAVGNHGESAWQWKCGADPLQHSVSAAGLLLKLIILLIFGSSQIAHADFSTVSETVSL